jgi:AcrR family transcriptional regulator
MSYHPPTQDRSRNTERRFLVALDDLLRVYGFANTTIDEVAERAGLTRAAFLRRFGSKEQAVLVLFSKYCDQVSEMMRSFHNQIAEHPHLHFTLREMSRQFEAILQLHMSSNRAMHEHFQQKLEVHDLTKQIFRKCVDLMKAIQARFLEKGGYTDAGAWNATQLLVTINYNYLLRAMPALPADHTARHDLVADLLEVALKR